MMNKKNLRPFKSASSNTRKHSALRPMHGTPVQRIQQLGPLRQRLPGLCVCEPVPLALVLLGPDGLLLLDRRLEELVGCFRRRGRELVGFPLLGNEAEVVVDFAYYARLLPGLALGGLLGRRLVRLPAALGEHPAAALGRLDEQHVVLVGRERDHAGDQSLALGAVAWAG
jgi:hypothetical protein